jgi:protein gp37
MGEKTAIEWCDHTFSPWIGCQKVSAACDHCYAEGWAKRSGLVKWGPGEPRRRTSESYWRQPIKWNREAQQAGVSRRVFCCSLADVFDNAVDPAWRNDLWRLIAITPHLDWLLLTKRPQNIAGMLPELWDVGWGEPGLGWPNVWLGTTAENQEELERRAWALAQIPARLRFISYEPALGPLNMRAVTNRWGTRWNALTGRVQYCEGMGPASVGKIGWVICGGESGPGRRPMDLEWARSVRYDCRYHDVPYFFKQVDKVLPVPPDLMVREFPA